MVDRKKIVTAVLYAPHIGVVVLTHRKAPCTSTQPFEWLTEKNRYSSTLCTTYRAAVYAESNGVVVLTHRKAPCTDGIMSLVIKRVKNARRSHMLSNIQQQPTPCSYCLRVCV